MANYCRHIERPRKVEPASILQDDTELSDIHREGAFYSLIFGGHRYLQYKLEEISWGDSNNAKRFIVTTKQGFILVSNKNVTFHINAEGSPQLYHPF